MLIKPYLFALSATVTSLALAPQAQAQTAGAFMNNPAFADPAPSRCISTIDIQHCAARDLRKADRDMSAQYSRLRNRLKPAARQRLLTEQRAWLKERDRGCIARGKRNAGGSLQATVVAQCWVTVTRARAKALSARRT